MVTVACSSDVPDAADPLAANLERATQVAHRELDKPWVLQSASSRYDLDQAAVTTLEDHAYVFVSDDGAASYWLVRFHADGATSSGPVAGRALFPLEAFDFTANRLTSVEAMDVAWNRIGEALLERCGPIDWIDVSGIRDADGAQWWRIDHSTVGEVHTVWVSAGTGALGDVEEEPC